jgi:hypothetical protein
MKEDRKAPMERKRTQALMVPKNGIGKTGDPEKTAGWIYITRWRHQNAGRYIR